MTINNLLPGAFDTDRLKATLQGAADKTGKSIDAVPTSAAADIPARRFGTAEEFGAICAFLCSVQAGYMTGQNVLPTAARIPGRSRRLHELDGAGIGAPQFQHCSNGPSIARGSRGRPSAGAPDGAAASSRARARSSCVVVGDPDLGQRLVGRHLAGDAAGVHALHRRLDAGMA